MRYLIDLIVDLIIIGCIFCSSLASDGVPTSTDFVRDDMDRIIVSYTSGNCIVYDLETTKPVLRFDLPNEVTNFALFILFIYLFVYLMIA